MIFRKVGIEVKASNLRRRIIATVLGASLVGTVPIASAQTSTGTVSNFQSMLDAHNAKFGEFSYVHGKERQPFGSSLSSALSLGAFTSDASWPFYGCPDDSWDFAKLTNYDADKNSGVGTRDRYKQALEKNRADCDASLQRIVDAAGKQTWSASMEALAKEDAALTRATLEESNTLENPLEPEVTAGPTYGPIALDIVKAKRKAYIEEIAKAKWSPTVERTARDAKAAMPAEVHGDIASAINEARQRHLNEIVQQKQPWSLEWASQLQHMEEYAPDLAKKANDRKFDLLVESFTTDGKGWSPEWEKKLNTATAGASKQQLDRKNAAIGKQRDAFMGVVRADSAPWSPEWEASLADFKKADGRRAGVLLNERRKQALNGFVTDNRSWTREWDDQIAPLAAVYADAGKLRAQRRSDFVRNTTANNAWNEINDRDFQSFIEDSKLKRVVLADDVLGKVDQWRKDTVDGLSENRKWSPKLEEEFAYLALVYPRAKSELEALRKQVAEQAVADMAANGWNLDADKKLAEVASVQHAPYGKTLHTQRMEGLEKLNQAAWTPEIDAKLKELGRVLPVAADAAQKRREATFEALDVPIEWSQEAETKLAGLVQVGFAPAVTAIDTLRAEKLASLEAQPRTPQRDVELGQLAEVYKPATNVLNGLPADHRDVPGDGASDGDTDASNAPENQQKPGENSGTDTKPGGNTKAPESETPQSPSEPDPTQHLRGDKADGSSVMETKEIVGIVIGALTALGGLLATLLPVIDRFMKR